MKDSFLLSSGFLLIGGALLAIVSLLDRSDFLWMLSIVLMLMGGVTLVFFWCREFFKRLPDIQKTITTSDDPKKEDNTDGNS